MDSLIDKITQWLKDGLIEAIMGKFSELFTAVNEKVGDIATQVGQTPED